MKVFLVWSGSRSFIIAEALYKFLPRVIQAVKPFFSREIEKGAKWSNEIEAALEGTHFGIVCLTPDNMDSTWIHFETGALSKTNHARIWTYLVDLKSTDVPQPLGKFQHTLANMSDTLRLLKTINNHLAEGDGEPLSEQILEDAFSKFWPSLEESLRTKTPGKPEESKTIKRDHGEMLEEIVELLRQQHRETDQTIYNVADTSQLKVTRKPVYSDELSTDKRNNSLADLMEWWRELVSQRQEIEKRLSYLDEVISDNHGSSLKGELVVLPRPVQRGHRVRGVLAAARKAIDQFSGPFDKNQLLAKLRENDEFADKTITSSNIRNALRLLRESGVIRVKQEATATSCAKYIKAA